MSRRYGHSRTSAGDNRLLMDQAVNLLRRIAALNNRFILLEAIWLFFGVAVVLSFCIIEDYLKGIRNHFRSIVENIIGPLLKMEGPNPVKIEQDVTATYTGTFRCQFNIDCDVNLTYGFEIGCVNFSWDLSLNTRLFPEIISINPFYRASERWHCHLSKFKKVTLGYAFGRRVTTDYISITHEKQYTALKTNLCIHCQVVV